ncbi:Cell morphogenesis protein PAG1 [Coemansia brasiliensis]|uniref:Cell morphogenesis protein PAG1 n=1 Tax=Coemansia brasiliensis TaxID=2650707 RepID=A0A9W8IGQ9_9FUNG|nr:Cell morphogenesis protein PAG1 [Coemansia brasiliensis]
MSGEPQNTDIDSKVLQDLAKHFHTPTQLTGFSHLNIADTSSSSPSTSIAMDPSSASGVPINFSSSMNRQMGSSFGTDYERSGLAGSFQQLQQNSFQQTPQQNLFRAQLGSSAQQEMFSPGTDDLGDLSPASSYPSHSLAAMASGAIPSSIPGTLLSNQRQAAQVATDHMLRMQAFSASPPPNSPGFQSMSLPAHSEWFENQLVQQQSIGSALDPSSFTAQQIAGSSAAEFSPQNQTLMSLMENDDADVQKVMEKRRRRRESHNAVERRRRDNINDRIHELYELLPESIIDLSVKPNKGVILKKSVEYIHQLNQIIHSQNLRIQELESGISSSAVGQQQQQQQQQPQPQASSGLAAMLAGAAGINTSRPQGSDGNMMNTGL